MTTNDSLKQKFSEFCSTTSIHGLIYAFLKDKITRFIWKIIFLLMLTLCIYQSTLNVLTYSHFGTKVSITYKTQNLSQFPSISFASIPLFRRKTFGNYSNRAFILATWYSEKEEQFMKLMKENERTCQSNFQSKFTRQFEIEQFGIIYDYGTAELFKQMTFTFETSVIKCFWKNIEINCSDCFINHFSDNFVGFTFNAGNEVVVEQDRQPIENQPLVKQASGLNIKKYNEENYVVYSPKQGLHVLMNVNQREYCGNENIKRGAGFMFTIHDINTIAIFMIEEYYYLTPGYSVDIAIRRVTHKSNLEQWGQCSSNVDVSMFPYLKGKNKQIYCLLQCATETTLNQCKCYPPQTIANHKFFQDNAALYNMTKGDIKMCWNLPDLQCMSKLRNQWVHDEPFSLMCPQCKQECIESKFEIIMTQSRIKKQNFQQYVNETNEDDFFKNFLTANFYFATMDLELIEISEAFTLRDMFIYLGNNIGLFLGMSFITLFEVADLIIHLCNISYEWYQNRIIVI